MIGTLLRALTAEPPLASKLAARLLALVFSAGARRVRARYAWCVEPVIGRALYRVNGARHGLHVRAGLPADALNCPCDLRIRRAAPSPAVAA